MFWIISIITLFIGAIIAYLSRDKVSSSKRVWLYTLLPIGLFIMSELTLHFLGFDNAITMLMCILNKTKCLAQSIVSLRSSKSSTPSVNAKIQAEYDQECDALFHSQPDLRDQYFSMKKSRPIAESRNLCGNYALSLAGRKTM